jgi:UDP-glucose 4-epimerase
MLDDAGGQHVFNLGAGRGVSGLEMMDAARRVTGADIPYDVGARRPGDPARLIADTTLARGKLKWEPGLSDIDTILETA